MEWAFIEVGEDWRIPSHEIWKFDEFRYMEWERKMWMYWEIHTISPQTWMEEYAE